MPAEHDQIPEAALAWTRAGKRAALATVVDTWGSAPRPKGAQLAISAEAEMVGSVSGGCVEGAVVAEALAALGGRPAADARLRRQRRRGLRGRPRLRRPHPGAGRAGRASGRGRRPSSSGSWRRRGRRGRPVVYAVRPEGWERRLVSGPGDPLWPAAAAALVADQSGFEGDWFLGVHNPPLRMAVIGAVHIAQALVPMARLAGYDPAVIDPREAFASEARFPGTRLSHDWPDAALAAFGLDTRTAVVTLTHDPKLDDPAIAVALRSPVFYVGCLGSPRTHAKRVERLRAAGFGEAEIARIHAPIGADIGAKLAGRDRGRHPRRDHRAAAAAGDAALRCASGRFPPPRPKARCWRIRWPAAGLRLKKGRVLGAADVAALAAAGVARGDGGAARAGRPARGRRRRSGGRGAGAGPGGARAVGRRRPSPAGSTSSPRRRGCCGSTAAAVDALNARRPGDHARDAARPRRGCGRGRWWRRSRSSPTRSAARRWRGPRRRRGRGALRVAAFRPGRGEPDPDADAGA